MTDETVDWGLLGETWRVQDFIQTKNPLLIKIANKIPKGSSQRDHMENVLAHVCKHFDYPLTWTGNPAIGRTANIFEWVKLGPYFKAYVVNEEHEYGWLLPNQTWRAKYGICIDTSCYFVTLLRVLEVPARVELGAVLDTESGEVLGLHAWGMVEIDGGGHIGETTIHPTSPGLIPDEDLYFPSKKFDIQYDRIAWFDETSYVENKEKSQKYESAEDQRFIKKA